MPITDDPNLNSIINSNKGKDISKPRYCKHCGKQLIYSNTNKDGKEDRTLEKRWKEKICLDCFGNNDGDNYRYKKF